MRRRQVFQAVRLGSVDVDFYVVGNPVFFQNCVEGHALNFDWVTLQSTSPSPCCIKRTKYISFVANPEGNTSRLIYNPDPLDDESPVGYLLSKPLPRSLHETRICLDGN